MIYVINTKYSADIKQAWELKKTISKEKRHIRQSGSRGHYAYFKLLFEKSEASVPIILETKSLINENSVARYNRYEKSMIYTEHDMQEEVKMYTETIISTIENKVDEFYKLGYPIVNLKITLSDMEIDRADSNCISFLIATSLILEEVLILENFLAV